jgi:hypothetical protein
MVPLAALGAVLVFGAAGCSSNHPHAVTPPVDSTTTSAPASGTTSTAAPVASTSTSTSTTAPGLQNLTVTDAVRAQLTAAYVAYKHIQISDLNGGGPAPGTVYYAFDPSTQTYWAIASYMPSATASQDAMVGMQDGGSDGFFKLVPGGSWQVALGSLPVYCSEKQFFPPAVVSLWSLPTYGMPAAACG